jgi:hypothetical protein
MRIPKMYVLVRLDLSTQYGLVQASHALAQYALELPDLFKVWGNGTLVCLGVRNLIEMKAWIKKLELMGKSYKCFYEPDLEGQVTSVACFDTGEIFKNLRIV